MRIEKNNIKIIIGYYNNVENIYYLYYNEYVDLIKQTYPNAIIQLSLF